MAKKYNAETKEAAINAINAGKTVEEVSAEMNIPASTLKGWIKNESKQEETPKPDEPANDEPKQDEAQVQDTPADNEPKQDEPKARPTFRIIGGMNNAKTLEVVIDGVKNTVDYVILEKLPTFKDLDEIKKYMTDLEGRIKILCDYWNTAKSINDIVVNSLGDDIDALCKLFNLISKHHALMTCLIADKPLIAAIEADTYRTIGAKEKAPKGCKMKERHVADRNLRIPIDALWEMGKKAEINVGENPHWYHSAQATNKKFLAACIKRYNKRDEALKILQSLEGYTMSDEAKALEKGEAPSNTKLLKAIRETTREALGEDFARNLISHDVAWIMDGYTKEDKKQADGLGREAATHRRFYDLLLCVWHKHFAGKAYTLKFK